MKECPYERREGADTHTAEKRTQVKTDTEGECDVRTLEKMECRIKLRTAWGYRKLEEEGRFLP